MLKNQYRAKIVTLFERGDIMNSKELLNRFGSTNLFLALNAIFCTRRVKNPEKARLLSNEKNFDFLFLEIELYKPMGVFGRKSFFFTLNKNNLKEAIKAFQNQEIKNWYIRKVFSVSFLEDRRRIQIYSQI